MNFAERLDELMSEKKLNSLRLAKEIGGSDRVVGAWRKGEYEPKLDSLVRLADFFDVSIDYLAGRSDLRDMATKKEPALVISENGQEMLRLYEQLPEREQLLLLGRLQEMVAPLLGATEASVPPAMSEGKAV